MQTKTLELLPHQLELIKDTETKILGLVSGYGAGKTFSAARKAVTLAMANPGCDGIVTEPNFPLISQILIPEMIAALDFFSLPYTFKGGEGVFYVDIQGKQTRIICKSMESYTRLIGINAAWVIMDEFDTAKPELAYKAYIKLLGRIRVGTTRQMIIVSTPESFGAMYKIFVEENNKDKRLIKAKTTDNIFLPEGYIDMLRTQYTPELIEAYINGEFVNLNSEAVYSYFSRELNHRDIELQEGETVHVSMDFNVGGCAMTFSVIRSGIPHTFGEDAPRDTLHAIDMLKDRFRNCEVIIYPDASGAQGSTNASKSDIALLDEAGFQIDVGRANPRIVDRVNSVNLRFERRTAFIDTNKCPQLTAALERQVYDDRGVPEKFSGPKTIDDWTDSYGYFINRKFGITTNRIRMELRTMI